MVTQEFNETLRDYYNGKITSDDLVQAVEIEARQIREAYEQVNPVRISFRGLFGDLLSSLSISLFGRKTDQSSARD